VEHSFGGPLGTLIAGLGMGAFYTALIWINMLLGIFLTPLFLIPLTWIQDALAAKKEAKA
jgi:predicted lipid-binding transport protein (Tim44 family)